MRHKQDPVAHGFHFVHVVRGPENAAILVSSELADLLAHNLCGGRVQGGRRLIQQQQLRLVEQCLGQGDTCLLTRGEQSATGIAQMLQVESLDQGLDALREVGMA